MNKRILELALKGLEAERDRVDGEIADLKAQLNGGARSTARSSSAQAASAGDGAEGRAYRRWATEIGRSDAPEMGCETESWWEIVWLSCPHESR